MSRIITFLLIVFFVSSCEKEAGEGGTSSIEGSVYKISTYYNVLTQQNDTVYYQLALLYPADQALICNV